MPGAPLGSPPVVTATILALAAAVLHAGWNFVVKQADEDRYLSLWGQFFFAGLISGAIMPFLGGPPASGWVWAGLSGLVHLPYCWYLARAYDDGDFSLVYPVARGGGALLAAIGGVALLHDRISALGITAVVVIATGLIALAGRLHGPPVRRALIVATTIGAYTVCDAKGIRDSDSYRYVFASSVATMTSNTAFGLASGRAGRMVDIVRRRWPKLLAVGIAASITYAMVQLALRLAPVGYVTAIRESSVVLAAFLGWHTLGERAGARRLVASFVVVGGLILLVVSR